MMAALAKPPSAMKMAVRTAVILLLFVVVFTGLAVGRVSVDAADHRARLPRKKK